MSGDAPARIAQGSKPTAAWDAPCATCGGDGQVMWHETGGQYIGTCKSCGGTGTDRGRRIHRGAWIGNDPEHREFIAGKVEALSPGVELGARVTISAGVTIDRGIHQPTRVGDGTLLMAKCHVAHDCQVGEHVEIGASAVLCGHVTVGDGAKVNGLAFVRPFITIGAGAHVGGGAVVTKDVKPNHLVVGNPARFLRYVNPKLAFEPSVEAYADAAELAREEHAERCMGSREAWKRFIAE